VEVRWGQERNNATGKGNLVGGAGEFARGATLRGGWGLLREKLRGQREGCEATRIKKGEKDLRGGEEGVEKSARKVEGVLEGAEGVEQGKMQEIDKDWLSCG